MDSQPTTLNSEEQLADEVQEQQTIPSADTGLDSTPTNTSQAGGEEAQKGEEEGEDQQWLSELGSDPLITAQPESGPGASTHLTLNGVQTAYLIGLYKMRPALYDTTHPDYKPRGGKATTLVQEEMAQQLSGVFGFDYSELL